MTEPCHAVHADINEDESVYGGPDSAALLEATLAGHMKLAEDLVHLVAAGVPFSGERLKPAATATTIRWDNGAATRHDGPFAQIPRGARRLLCHRCQAQGPRR